MPTDALLRPAVDGDADGDGRRSTWPPGARRRCRRASTPTTRSAPGWPAGCAATTRSGSPRCDGRGGGVRPVTDDWLDDLYVAPGGRRAGLGSALLDLVKARRPDGFCLWVFEMNAPARGFYARHGLVELERTDGSGNEERAPDLRMAWPGTDPLAFFRRLIDDVDDQLGDLLARRAALTHAVQEHKHDRTRDPDREREIAERLAARAPALGADRLARIVHAIITESLDALRRLRPRSSAAAGGLPEAHEVALGVLDVRREAHLADRLPPRDRRSRRRP